MRRSFYKVYHYSFNILCCTVVSLVVHVLSEVLQQLFNSLWYTVEACTSEIHSNLTLCWRLSVHTVIDVVLIWWIHPAGLCFRKTWQIIYCYILLWVHPVHPCSALTKSVSGISLHTGGKWNMKTSAFTSILSIHLLCLFQLVRVGEDANSTQGIGTQDPLAMTANQCSPWHIVHGVILLLDKKIHLIIYSL